MQGHTSSFVAHFYRINSGRKLQGAFRLLVRRRRRRKIEHHERLAISAESFLQQVGQRAVSIWDVLRLFTKCNEDVTQEAQTLVNCLRLLPSSACRL